ncbi:MAG: dihydrofolate reductase [Acidobacteria bacterium]|nr:MAG: dihydrofolate reductase [Acidobacteriota bacterium]REK09333.1 MAG: dihydrofolate reductase [Acidobacteriota bacterium]
MQRIVGHGLSISLDGFAAGPDQSHEAPLGVGGEKLHEWAFATRSMRHLHGMEGGDEDSVDDRWARRSLEGIGATIVGRNMFGPVRGAWGDSGWRGWWGDAPPFHHPVFVLTHHAREPLEMQGGTTFHFVDGADAALDSAREAAGGLDVRVAGGATTVRQFLAIGAFDELHVAIVPVLLGRGTPLFGHGLDLTEHYEVARWEAGERAHHVLLARTQRD